MSSTSQHVGALSPRQTKPPPKCKRIYLYVFTFPPPTGLFVVRMVSIDVFPTHFWPDLDSGQDPFRLRANTWGSSFGDKTKPAHMLVDTTNFHVGWGLGRLGGGQSTSFLPDFGLISIVDCINFVHEPLCGGPLTSSNANSRKM